MEAYLLYIGKVALAAGAFYLAFLLLFQNQKHFTFNRIYLPVSLLLSFVIPLITFTTVKYIEPVTFESNSFAYLPGSTKVQQPDFELELYHYLFALYILGVAGFLFHLLLGHLKAISIIRKSRVQKLFENLVNITSKDVHPFSFFNKIVLSEKTLAHPNLEMIVEHENIHVKEKHTLDILFAEILFLLQWFNPFAWLLKDAVKNNLEYLTDHEIAKTHHPQTYQLAMVSLADKQGVAPFLTALNGSQLKNRIVMMKKKTENKFAVLKQLAVLPLLAILVMGLSNKEVKTEVIQPAKIEIETPRSIAGKESDSAKDFISVLFANPVAEPTGNALTGIQKQKTIKGKITDVKGEPLSAVAILIKDKPIGTITDQNGNYEIKLENENETLVFILGDSEKVEIPVENKTEINVKLNKEKPAENKITGNANQNQQAKFAHSVKGKITDKEGKPVDAANVIVKGKPVGTITDPNGNYEIGLENENETLVFASKGYEKQVIEIDGRVEINVKLKPDLNFEADKLEINTSGNGEQNTKLTGNVKIKSASGNQPLYIVDGVEIANIENINRDNIQSIDVLKNESTTKIYGEKGKNGVILITMKKEKASNEITSILEFRRFIAERVKYPVSAQENGIVGKISMAVTFDKTGKIVKTDKSSLKYDNMDEVVVVGNNVKKIPLVQNNESEALQQEMIRIINILPVVNIDNIKDKTFNIVVNFQLQE